VSYDLGEHYWRTQYSDPKTIDGIGNVKDHSAYLRAFFNLEGFNVESLIDLGFGTGHLLKEMVRTFKPIYAEGIEPSEYVFKKFRSPQVTTARLDLHGWCQKHHRRIFDLGICTSVLQYLSDREIREVLPVLSQRVRYLYLTVPTDVEYQRQDSELHFQDPYAKIRTRDWYQKILRPHFTFLSTRILESKRHYNETTTPFNDLLFRY
jgi:trans-aconitate methyltransferase